MSSIKGYLDAIEKASSTHEVTELTDLILKEVTGLGRNQILHLSESWLAEQGLLEKVAKQIDADE